MSDKPLLSVAVITYNQENFIRQCLDGMINQITNFPFEIVIGEDCSTDNTRKICIEYQNKYPHLIRLDLPEKNRGMMENFIQTSSICQGKYIATCEGDDYWIDPHKLQKQVDFLEQNDAYSMCATNSQKLQDGIISIDPIGKDVLTTDDILLQDWGLMTATLVFRKDAFQIPQWYKDVKNGDYAMQLMVSLKGLTKVLPDVTSVYRIHQGGVSKTLTAFVQCAWIVYLLYEFNKTTEGKYYTQIKKKIKRVYKNQIGFAKEYHLRKAYVKLQLFNSLRIINPFMIKNYR